MNALATHLRPTPPTPPALPAPPAAPHATTARRHHWPAPAADHVGVRHDLITMVLQLVRLHGSATALDLVRVKRPVVRDGRYHDTLAVYFVWAIDRLVRAGLSDQAILWHPLADGAAPFGWWDPATLASPLAADRFVSPTVAQPAEPMQPRWERNG